MKRLTTEDKIKACIKSLETILKMQTLSGYDREVVQNVVNTLRTLIK